jgi:molybdate transport system substrate-binding protein
MHPAIVAATIGIAVMLAPGAANAAEIKVVASNGVKAALEALAPLFERSSEHKLKMTFGTAVPLKREIDGGETFDVVILTPPLVQDLVKSGKVVAGSPASVAKAGVGVGIRAGAPKPDISTVESFKRTLLNAKSIIYSKEGQSGAHMAGLVVRLGLAEQLKAKTILETRAGQSIHEVAAGRAEIGFSLVSEVLAVAGAALAGPLPEEAQSYTVLTAGIGTGAKDAAAAKSLIDFLKSPAALPALKASGMEPG